jgi:menaquinone-9 beta-reductase
MLMAGEATYDVAIVGGSIAGCTAAILLARRGARVALIEREKDASAFKRICTHYIQPSATPTIERLGLAARIEAAGAVRNGAEIWTRWGWIRPSETVRQLHGYNIRREKLDPVLRQMAADTPGVDFMPGHSAQSLIMSEDRPRGVRTETSDGARRDVIARLVVGADGRHSRIADLAGITAKVKPHGRFLYFAHFRDLPLATGAQSQIWILEPDVAYAFPNDDGVTLLGAMATRDKLERWKSDLAGGLQRFFEKLPRGPSLATAKRVSPVMGMVDMPNLTRRAARPGLPGAHRRRRARRRPALGRRLRLGVSIGRMARRQRRRRARQPRRARPRLGEVPAAASLGVDRS